MQHDHLREGGWGGGVPLDLSPESDRVPGPETTEANQGDRTLWLWKGRQSVRAVLCWVRPTRVTPPELFPVPSIFSTSSILGIVSRTLPTLGPYCFPTRSVVVPGVRGDGPHPGPSRLSRIVSGPGYR